MAAGDLITADWQFEFAGFLFGGNTLLENTKIVGLGMPDVRNGDVAKPRDHGMIAGTDYLAGRTVTFTHDSGDGNPSNLATALDALAVAGAGVGQGETPLVFQLPGYGKRRINCRMRKRDLTIDLQYLFGLGADHLLEFFATDPRIYDNTQTVVALTLPTVSGGLGWPLGWPLGWGTAVSGFATATNSGTFATRPVITFSGPLTAPSVQNLTAGATWACTFDLQAGDSLVVDFSARTVLLNGTASRYSYVMASTVWWELAPGANQLQMSATAGTGTASVAFRSAWL